MSGCEQDTGLSVHHKNRDNSSPHFTSCYQRSAINNDPSPEGSDVLKGTHNGIKLLHGATMEAAVCEDKEKGVTVRLSTGSVLWISFVGVCVCVLSLIHI